MVDFNEIRPQDALGDKTPTEVYRDSERPSLAAIVPSYPHEWEVRRVSRNGLRWRARFFDVDLGTTEVAPLDSALTTDGFNASIHGAVNP